MLEELGADKISKLLPGAILGAVNLAEVVAKLQERGAPDETIDRNIARLDLRVIPFDAAQALLAGKLRARTRRAGLSLGDRACLALAVTRGLPAVTMDRGWAALDIGVQIIVARH
jgi:PIN domain nuclease of toxin-antitoxin system